MTRAELERDVREMYDALVAGVGEGDRHTLADASFAELRALLADVSHTRARQGFSSTETAVGVFALKEAMLGVLEEHGDLATYRSFADFSRLIDADGREADDGWRVRRAAALAELAERLQPDAVLFELFPFGRRQFRFELLPLIDTLRARHPRPAILSSVREDPSEPPKLLACIPTRRAFGVGVSRYQRFALHSFLDCHPPAGALHMQSIRTL